jgi:hypothetical protein
VHAETSGDRRGRKDVQQIRGTAAGSIDGMQGSELFAVQDPELALVENVAHGDAGDPVFYRGLVFALGWSATAWALVAGVVWALTRWR